jgi:hypothetical protein
MTKHIFKISKKQRRRDPGAQDWRSTEGVVLEERANHDIALSSAKSWGWPEEAPPSWYYYFCFHVSLVYNRLSKKHHVREIHFNLPYKFMYEIGSNSANPEYSAILLVIWPTFISIRHIHAPKFGQIEFAWTIGVPRIAILLKCM